MPQRMNMLLDNSNRLATRTVPQFDANLAHAPAVKLTPSALNTSIIARIHSVKPGCGSCGKKI
jgi:hypothetical protein